LERREGKVRGKETFDKTQKLEEFLLDPRLFSKPSGVQIGLIPTSDR